MKPFTDGQILTAEQTEQLLKTDNGTTNALPDNRLHAVTASPEPGHGRPEAGSPVAPAVAAEPLVEPKTVKAKTTFLATKKSFKVTLLPDHHRIAQVWADMKGISIEALLQDLLEKELEQRGKVGAARIDRPGWAPRQLISGPTGSVKVEVPTATQSEPAPSVDFNF